MTCTKERLIKLSDWLNDNLDFDHGEDFNKIADKPRTDEANPEETNECDLCKTDRTTMVRWLELMSDLIPQLPNGSSTRMQNIERRMKLLAEKLRKSLPQQS